MHVPEAPLPRDAFYSLLGVSCGNDTEGVDNDVQNHLSTPFWEFHHIIKALTNSKVKAIAFLLPFGSFDAYLLGFNSDGKLFVNLSTPFWEFLLSIFKEDLERWLQATFYSLLGVSIIQSLSSLNVSRSMSLSTPFWEFHALKALTYSSRDFLRVAFYSLLGVSCGLLCCLFWF